MSSMTEMWMKGKVIVSYWSDAVRPSSSFHLAAGLTTLFLLRLLLLLLFINFFVIFRYVCIYLWCINCKTGKYLDSYLVILENSISGQNANSLLIKINM